MRYLVDANLPSKVPTWQKESFWFVNEIDEEWTDSEIWNYARKNAHTIVTKDADFSHRIIVSEPPPRIIHLRIGNMRLRDFIAFVEENWKTIQKASKQNKLVNVYRDRVECVK
jgi:predicted nuclease of predicted toxin-antitoxin system